MTKTFWPLVEGIVWNRTCLRRESCWIGACVQTGCCLQLKLHEYVLRSVCLQDCTTQNVWSICSSQGQSREDDKVPFQCVLDWHSVGLTWSCLVFSSKLGSLFGQDQSSSGNESLRYTAPKEPRKQKTGGSCVFCEVSFYRVTDNNGKGCACFLVNLSAYCESFSGEVDPASAPAVLNACAVHAYK